MDPSALWSRLLEVVSQSLLAHPARPLWTLVGCAVGTALVVLGPAWVLARPLVTIVHELGHALVGMACGRRFTGFVVSTDMSGHTLTRGRPRGPGIVVTTLAGYPAPALVGGALVWAGVAGWSRAVLGLAGVAMTLTLVRARSLWTVLVLAGFGVGSLTLWWSGPEASAAVVVAAGVVLLVGAWRQVLAVAGSGDPGQDPAEAARLTGVPGGVWVAGFLVVIAASSAWAASMLVPVVRTWAAGALGAG